MVVAIAPLAAGLLGVVIGAAGAALPVAAVARLVQRWRRPEDPETEASGRERVLVLDARDGQASGVVGSCIARDT